MSARRYRVIAAAVLSVVSLLPGADVPGGRTPRPRSIIGGAPATVQDHPSALFLVINSTPPRTCTGSLVSAAWALTAAHCVDGVAVGENSWESELIVVHGYPSVTEIRHAVSTVMHPDWSPLDHFREWGHDIALVRINEPYLSRTAVAADLATADQAIFLQAGVFATLVGWGGVDAQSMTAASWAITACPEGSEGQVCTAYHAALSLESGDSGGQLLLDIDGAPVLAGVHSSVDPEDGVHRHISVAAHREWIEGVLSAEEPVIEACPDPTGVIPPPPPPPSPFVPQAVEVALGTSGDTLVLMTAAAGGYTLNGAPFVSGSEHTAGNGSTYTLILDGTAWSAAYKMPEPTLLALGTADSSISIERLEDGSYRANGRILTSGTVVTSENGNKYTVRISDGGTWTATLRP